MGNVLAEEESLDMARAVTIDNCVSGGKVVGAMGRIGEIHEIVHALLYLTEATFVTGEVLRVDGGQHAGRW